MAVTVTVPNHCKYLLGTAAVNFSSDTFKIILMKSSFIFDKDAHAELADVTSNQLSTEYGYTQNSKALSGVVVNEDDGDDRLEVTWDNPSWTASGGPIGPTGSAIVYDDTLANDPIVMCIAFGANYTIEDTASFSIKNIAFYVS